MQKLLISAAITALSRFPSLCPPGPNRAMKKNAVMAGAEVPPNSMAGVAALPNNMAGLPAADMSMAAGRVPSPERTRP